MKATGKNIVVLGFIALISSFGCKDKKAEEVLVTPPPATNAPAAAAPAPKATAKPKAFVEPASLQLIPAETPYFFASIEAFPKPICQKYEALMAPVWKLISDEVSKKRAMGDEMNTSLGTAERVMYALFDEMNEKGFSNTGLNPSHFVLYGIGILPALRMELQDQKKFQAFMDRVQEKSGMKFPAQSLGSQLYWVFEEKGISFILAATSKEFVAGAIPNSLLEKHLPLLLGINQPEENLTSSQRVSKLVADFHSNPNGVGFIDLQKLAATFLGEGTGLNAEVAKAIGINTSFIPTERKSQIQDLMGKFPGLVFGYQANSDTELETWGALQTSYEIGKTLSSLTLPVSGVEFSYPQNEFLFSFGMGLDVAKAFECLKASVAEFNGEAKDGKTLSMLEMYAWNLQQTLRQPLPPAIMQLKGFYFVLQEVLPNFESPQNFSALISVVSENPMQLVNMAKAMILPLQGLEVQPDGKPVAFPKEISIPLVRSPYIAVSEKALAISVGAGNEKNLPKLLNMKAKQNSPVFVAAINYNKLMGKMSKQLEKQMAAMEGQSESQKAGQKFAIELMNSIDKAMYSIDFEEQGIVGRTKLTLR